jgi:L-alanine-DL-glutamate epimerase-like enolase superfamily enzyme
MLDCTSMYTYTEALRIGRALDEMKYYWYEDPIRIYQMPHLAELTRRLETPVAIGDPEAFRFQEAASYLAYEAADILRSDTWKDGITGVKKLADMCEGFGKNCEIHAPATATGNVATLHLVLAIKDYDFFEFRLQGPSVYRFGIQEEMEVDRDGFAHAPAGPGLGVTVDWDLLNRLTLETLA